MSPSSYTKNALFQGSWFCSLDLSVLLAQAHVQDLGGLVFPHSFFLNLSGHLGVMVWLSSVLHFCHVSVKSLWYLELAKNLILILWKNYNELFGQPNIWALLVTNGLSSVQLLSCVRLFATPWTEAHQASLSITNSWSSPKPMAIESVMPSNHLILCRPLLLLLSIFPSIRVFSNESALCTRWPKYWSFSFSISPSNEYSGLISFRMNRWPQRMS